MSLTAEQKEIRRTRIGSSDIGAILGVDPHRSSLAVFNDKMLPVDDVPSPEMEWGAIAERGIIEYHARRSLAQWIVGDTIAHANGFTCATPDAYLFDGEQPATVQGIRARVVECKNVGFYNAREWGDEGDDAPFHYLAQVHWQLGHAKAEQRFAEVREEAHLVPAIGNSPPRLYVVRYDPELYGLMLDRAAQFVRDHLETGRPPELDGTPAGDEYLRRRYGVKHREELLFPTEETLALHHDILVAEIERKEIEKREQAARQRLCELVGEAAGIEGICTWKTQKATTFTVDRAATRVLRIVRPRETKR